MAEIVFKGGKAGFASNEATREEHESGMVRDSEEGKPRFDLLLCSYLDYEEQMLTRDARRMAHGANLYGERNWEKGDSPEEWARARSSAFRHFMQWFNGETDEDHAAAARCNISFAEAIKQKIERAEK